MTSNLVLKQNMQKSNSKVFERETPISDAVADADKLIELTSHLNKPEKMEDF